MKREELADKIREYADELRKLSVKELILGRECSLENISDCTIPIVVNLIRDDYEAYNSVQDFLSKNISPLLEVIPSDFFEAKMDDHFDKDAVIIRIMKEER
ncbi:MAG: hypothetical protein N3B13_11010 [Deltaproteobacteria bacterium]|nr:hypothetical protein [Deltaproteobacteria bacterium]